MNALVTLLIICCLYYTGYRYLPNTINETTHRYFAIGVAVYLVIYYVCVFQTDFTYKLFKNIHGSAQEPLYTSNSQHSNGDLYRSHNPNADIKTHLWTRQEYRCSKCMNPLLKPDDGLLTYTIPLQHGGSNDPHNLSIVCPGCHMFL